MLSSSKNQMYVIEIDKENVGFVFQNPITNKWQGFDKNGILIVDFKEYKVRNEVIKEVQNYFLNR